MSVDVEDYFQVEAFAGIVNRYDWPRYSSRVERNTERLLDLFDELDVRATFFILGWTAQRFPRLVRQIVRRGHEPACHSYWHRRVYRLTPAEFRRDTARAKDIIEQAAGLPIFGYRAPSFSITLDSLWAFEELAALGFHYDSSIFPVKHDVYGIPGATRKPFQAGTGSIGITEFPLTTFRIGPGPNLPVGGGGYLRLLPFPYTKAGAERVWREGLTVISYVHPWELDVHQPRLNGPIRSRLRHYTNLHKTEERLRKLLALDRFTSFRDSGHEGCAPAQAIPLRLRRAAAQ